jgi:branched-chain amino acid transport system substrate-binding protein
MAMNEVEHRLPRRTILKGLLAGVAVTSIARPAFAVPETVKIGLVGPKTGRFALFYEEMSYAIDSTLSAMNHSITINGAVHPLEIVVKDSQSSPNRASEVAQELILNDKVHIVTAFATPETVNPVADQCELNGVPCVSNDAPLEPYFFGRKGNPKKGFEWTYHFFFSGPGAGEATNKALVRVPTNKKTGVLWANDTDGRTMSRVVPPTLTEAGLVLVDPGRFDLPASDFTPEISAFKAAGVEIVYSVIPGPDFTVFWNQAAQQDFKPKALVAGKVAEFPQAVYVYSQRATNFLTEVWWSKFHPFASGLTGQSSSELAESYEKSTNQQASMALGFRHSLIEVAVDALKRSQSLDPGAIRDALRDTDYKSIVGPINFKKYAFPNVCETKLVMGQWRKGEKWPVEVVIVDNAFLPEVPVQGVPEAITYLS